MDSRMIETAAGRKVRVHEAGTGESLVFLHGAGGLFPNDPFIARLAERYRVHAPVLPGFEDSEGADSMRDMLDFTLHTLDVLDALGLDRPIVVGHSMGGMIAAEMAAIAPHQIDRLALIAPAGLWLDQHPIPDIFAMLPFELPPVLFHDEVLGTKLLTAGLDFDDAAFLQDFLIRNAKQLGMAGKILFPVPERGLAERLYRVRAKTVVVWGESDKLIVPAYGDAFVEQIRGAELVRVPAAGHMVTLEQPDAVVEAIARVA
jgi:pimeloyl-ACP methyl ester carboxylesterase